jgi:hypothetical protein
MDMDEMDYFSVKRRRGSIDEEEEKELEEYFNTSYVPLSNLPTPPMSSACSPIIDPQISPLGGNFSSKCYQTHVVCFASS